MENFYEAESFLNIKKDSLVKISQKLDLVKKG
jgi:hypothetical protein